MPLLLCAADTVEIVDVEMTTPGQVVPQSEPGNSNSRGTHVRDGDDQSIAGGALKLVHPLDKVLAKDKLRGQLAHRFECLTSIRWNQLDNHDRDSFSTRSTHGSSR